MKTLITSAACIAALTLPGDTLTRREAAGQSVTRTFSFETELELLDSTMSVDGEEQENPFAGEMEHVTTRSLNLVVVDTVRAAEDGEATAFTRAFETIEGHSSMSMSMPMMDAMESESDESSELEGQTVVFTQGDDGFEASYPEDQGGDEDLLEGLDARLDLGQLLPEGEVEEGATWEVDPGLLELLRSPGGDLHLEGDEDVMAMGMTPDPEGFEYDGEIIAEYSGTREVGGRELAVISLKVDLGSTTDLTELVQNQELPEDLPEGAVMPDIDSLIQGTWAEGEGEALWDVEAGRLHSLELELEVENAQTVSMTMDFGGGGQSMEQCMTMGGVERFVVGVEE